MAYSVSRNQIVPIGAPALLSSKIVNGLYTEDLSGRLAELVPTHTDQVNADLLAIPESCRRMAAATV